MSRFILFIQSVLFIKVSSVSLSSGCALFVQCYAVNIPYSVLSCYPSSFTNVSRTFYIVKLTQLGDQRACSSKAISTGSQSRRPTPQWKHEESSPHPVTKKWEISSTWKMTNSGSVKSYIKQFVRTFEKKPASAKDQGVGSSVSRGHVRKI